MEQDNTTNWQEIGEGYMRVPPVRTHLRRQRRYAITESTMSNELRNIIIGLRQNYNCEPLHEEIKSHYTLKNNSEQICGVCYNELQKDKKIFIFKCFHYLCEECYQTSRQIKKFCPFCKLEMETNEYVKTNGEFGVPPMADYEKETIKIINNDRHI